MWSPKSRCVAGALAATLTLLLANWWLTDSPGKTLPDRDTTRVEHITDLQLPTL